MWDELPEIPHLPPIIRSRFIRVPNDGQKRVALTREDITAFQVSILHGDEAHQRWLIMEFERWVDKLFGEEQVG